MIPLEYLSLAFCSISFHSIFFFSGLEDFPEKYLLFGFGFNTN